MNKLLLLLCFSLFLSACKDKNKDLATAPDSKDVGRLGLQHIKLGSPSENVLKQFKQLLKKDMKCSQKKVAFGAVKRNFIHKNCILPRDIKTATFWGEPIKSLHLEFLDNRLVNMGLELKISGQYQTLYNKHGKKVLTMLGRPSSINFTRVQWKNNSDKAILEDKGNGIAKFSVYNQKITQTLAKTRQTMKKPFAAAAFSSPK